MLIPGIYNLVGKEYIPNSVLLLTGPSGVGKSVYCRHFFLEGLLNGDYCIYVSSLLNNIQFRTLFSNVEGEILNENSFLVNPCQRELDSDQNLLTALEEIKTIITAKRMKDISNKYKQIRLVIDSITHLFILFGEKLVETFLFQLYFILKKIDAKAIFTLTTSSINEYVINRLSSIFDGIIEMKLEEKNTDFNNPNFFISSSIDRFIRILSIKSIGHTSKWIKFEISHEGNISFGNYNLLHCYLCKDPITDETPVIYSELPFHSHHLEMYKKFIRLYGLNVTDIGLSSSEAINGSFFFIDIVGLSDPSLSVNKQREKIENLNNIISSCDAFKTIDDNNKVILPTGDGMVIGYLINPELPLQLSIQIHQKLKEYNINKKNNNKEQDQIGVRIGLSSGPVFKVNDIKNNPNYWGPGIILARRVMDIGNNGHILMANNLAESLIPLKEEYKKIIKPVGKYQIKHGQFIGLFSVYSEDFGNSESPLFNRNTVIYLENN